MSKINIFTISFILAEKIVKVLITTILVAKNSLTMNESIYTCEIRQMLVSKAYSDSALTNILLQV